MYGAFGAIPMDSTTVAAYALIQAIDAGQDASAFIAGADPASRAAICQRSIDILNLPACQAGMDASAGTCLDPTGLQTPTATLKSKIAAACAAQGASVSGAGLSKYTWLAIGAVAVGVGWYLFGPEL